MSKGFSAADMLSNSRRTSPRSTEEQVDQSTSRVVDESGAASAPAAERVTYVKMAVSLTPEQRGWLKTTPQQLALEGLSASDLVRLAISRLRDDVDGGLPLADLLIEQAHDEADRLTGRRNRGLPRRAS